MTVRARGSLDTWLAAALFAALTLILTYPLSLHPGSTSLGSDADVHTFTWTLAWDAHAVLRQPFAIFNANIFYPYDRTLAFSENLMGSVIVAGPVLWLTGNPVLALNMVSLVSCLLCGLGAYVLGRRLGLGAPAALLCGIIFAFSPARFFRFAQTHLTTIQWIPFALAYLWTYFDHGRARDLRIAIGFFSLQALTSLHGAVYLTLAGDVLILSRLVAGVPLAPLTRVRDLGVAGVALLVPILLMIPTYLRVQKEMGLVRTLENWVPAPESFLASPTLAHAWLIARLWQAPINERASAFLFPGYLPLLLAAAALVAMASTAFARGGPGEGSHARWRRPAICFAVVALLGVLLSAGPPLSPWPWVYWLPGLNFIRIPSRFFLLAVLGIAVLAGIGFDVLTARLMEQRRRLIAMAAGLVLVAEFALIPLPVTPYRVEFAAVDRWLDTQPKPFAIAEVPVGPSIRYHSTYMLHSIAHWQKTVHGHSSLLPPLHENLYDQLRSFPDDASLENLTQLGVDYIVVHTDMYQPGEWAAVEKRIEGYGPRLILKHEDASGRVYELRTKN